MESSSDMAVTSPSAVHLLKPTIVSAGLTVCRLFSGHYAIALHQLIDRNRFRGRWFLGSLYLHGLRHGLLPSKLRKHDGYSENLQWP